MDTKVTDAADAAWATAPSPCVDICKYKRQGRCVGCSMTKAEKQAFPSSGGAEQKREFIETLIGRLQESARNPAFWIMSYRRKCEREGVPCPIPVEGDDG
ncbi:DUF1289 domain-containing protein [Aurantimonas coralicida]|uniref:DUF1289 domain-containing protein n=1 Tax=Aurantimonas coralicida TaxID=182270 RepID=UPI002398A3E3|nr:DUF1289 domain-containing protein [Aurantimonas coralicida]MDE0924740.1 DUF1289 domain-containing protein [Aurantimonas coralicida]